MIGSPLRQAAVDQISDRARLIGDGFGVEIALAWPVIGDQVGHEVIAATGHADRVILRLDQVFQYAIRMRADGIILSHNHLHDSGPSAADHAMTRRLVAAGHLLGIPLRASLVVEPSGTHDVITDRWWPSRPALTGSAPRG